MEIGNSEKSYVKQCGGNRGEGERQEVLLYRKETEGQKQRSEHGNSKQGALSCCHVSRHRHQSLYTNLWCWVEPTLLPTLSTLPSSNNLSIVVLTVSTSRKVVGRTSRQQPLMPTIILSNNRSVAWKGLRNFPFLKVQVQTNQNKQTTKIRCQSTCRAYMKSWLNFQQQCTHTHAFMHTHTLGKGVLCKGSTFNSNHYSFSSSLFSWLHKRLMKMSRLNRTGLITEASIIYKSPESCSHMV